jgi:hypothetical protein
MKIPRACVNMLCRKSISLNLIPVNTCALKNSDPPLSELQDLKEKLPELQKEKGI